MRCPHCGKDIALTSPAERLLFFTQIRARSPFGRLFLFTVGVTTVMGAMLGTGLGMATGYFRYYLFKETLLGFVGGLSAPLFLLALCQIFRHQLSESRPRRAQSVYQALYVVSGALAGIVLAFLWSRLPRMGELGMWIFIFPLACAGLFPLIAAIADFFEETRWHEHRTRQALIKYVSQTVAEKILAQEGEVKLEGERRVVTILSTDIRDFNRMARQLAPEELVQVLNDYFERMVDVIFKYDGAVDKFIGDGILIHYGAPLTLGDETYRAVQTALGMYTALKEINTHRQREGQSPIRIGSGIDVGEVVVGNVGSELRLEYTVIGLPVNTATYLCSIAPPGHILLSQAAYDEVKERVEAVPWQRVRVKGATEEVQVYALLGEE
ncbi:MAG: adenylate/guanylate cyclase domain-containing protein [Anaerolineae bacterium]